MLIKSFSSDTGTSRTDGRTDYGQTDRIVISISRVSTLGHDFYYIHGPVNYYKKPSDFCCFKCVIEQWALTVINVKNFLGSLTALLRAQSDTSKTAISTDTIFK